MVVCALSIDHPIGIDIEQHDTIELHQFISYFTPKEWLDINSAENTLQRFYWYWTRKESIIKALGKNLAYLHQIEIDSTQDYFEVEGVQWYLKDIKISDKFSGSLCAQNRISFEHHQLDLLA